MKWLSVFLFFSISANAASPLDHRLKIAELNRRIRGFDLEVGSELGPQFINEEAKRLRSKLLRMLRPNANDEVELENFVQYRSLAIEFNRKVARVARRPSFNIPLLPIRRRLLARAVLSDYLEEKHLGGRDAINMIIASVSWNSLPLAIRLLETSRRAGMSDVSFATADVISRVGQLRKPGIQRIIKTTHGPDFNPLRFTCESLLN